MKTFLTLLEKTIKRVALWLWTFILMTFAAGVAVVVVLGTIYLIKAGISLFEAKSNAWCESKWEQSGLGVQWKAGVGCMVYVNGRWVPEANVQLGPK